MAAGGKQASKFLQHFAKLWPRWKAGEPGQTKLFNPTGDHHSALDGPPAAPGQNDIDSVGHRVSMESGLSNMPPSVDEGRHN